MNAVGELLQEEEKFRDDGELLVNDQLSFSVEGRHLRELGERLVRQPEVALVELVKNAYDADAKTCLVRYEPPVSIMIVDDGRGMTEDEFKNGWMRIGTSSKESERQSRQYSRIVTGEKGLGRFAVRFLGTVLTLRTVADDATRNMRTVLGAKFHWPNFDHAEDLGKVLVPYTLRRASERDKPGTSLQISSLRESALSTINLDHVRTATIGVVTPHRSLLRDRALLTEARGERTVRQPDPGFSLTIHPSPDAARDGDVALAILDAAVLRAVVELENERVKLQVFRRGSVVPAIAINDKFQNSIGYFYADIRFFPKRKGTFADLHIDGRRVKTWLKEYGGVAVFDRGFQVRPYGTRSDDWLFLAEDAARRAREPRSSLALKYFPMDEPTRKSTQLNYMLRLPRPQQLIGVVQVEGQRSLEQSDNADGGLIPAADREGFVDNNAFRQLFDVVRGAVEAIAAADRELQLDQDRAEQAEAIRRLREETRAAIREIEANPGIRAADKVRIVRQLTQTQELANRHEELTREREATLEVMSLLGVVAGFMTHEFGAALAELESGKRRLFELREKDSAFQAIANTIEQHISALREFATYTQGYIRGADASQVREYPARPRVLQVKRIFGKYAAERGIEIDIEVDSAVMAPLVPVSLYNGILLNLYTNALKAVTSRAGAGDRRIAFRAWNEHQWHHVEVSDTGVGIPSALRKRVFDPLFTTTASNRDPLGSGMGLGLALVKRGVESFGGRAEVIDPPPGFASCFRIKLPLAGP